MNKLAVACITLSSLVSLTNAECPLKQITEFVLPTEKAESDNHSVALWLMLANRCDDIKITEWADLTMENFLVVDEQDRSIYDIALQKHKETSSIPCARMAVFLQGKAEDLHRIALAQEAAISWEVAELLQKQSDAAARREALEKVIERFENPHK